MVIAPASPVAGTSFTKTITITNDGPDEATNVVLTDDLPAGLTLVSASTTAGTCNDTDPVVCTVPALASGASVTVTLTLQAASAGSFTNSVFVTSDQDVAGETDSETFTVTPAAAGAVAAIPTASEYGLFALMALLALLAIKRLR
jgi:uncharacterized repeat protein (TIGR01451 family)